MVGPGDVSSVGVTDVSGEELVISARQCLSFFPEIGTETVSFRVPTAAFDVFRDPSRRAPGPPFRRYSRHVS